MPDAHHNRSPRRGLLSATCALCLVVPARANEPSAIPPALELPAGGLVFNSRDRVVVERETLTIALEQINIDYTVRSTADRPTSLVMAFPLPVIDMANLFGAELAIPAFDPANPTNFVGYWTTINEVATEPDVDLRAFAIGHADATQQLRDLGLPLYPLAPDLADKLAALSADAREALDAANLIDNDGTRPQPLWSLSTVFHWRHVLPAEATVAIRHHYQPVAGSAPWSDDLKTKVAAKYCLTEAEIAKINAKVVDGKAPTVYWVHYVPANNAWLKGESAQHTLVIQRPEGDGVAASCVAGLRETTDTGFRITTKNRTDDKEIVVLFVE